MRFVPKKSSLRKINNWRGHKRLYHALFVGVTGCLIILILSLVQPFYNINRWVTDQFFSSSPSSPNIVVVGIDDATLKTYGKWSTWSRQLHALAINNLSQAGARVIGFDIIFAENTPDDNALAAAIYNANNVVLAEAGVGILPSKGEVIYKDFLMPSDPLTQASRSLGHTNVSPDVDGKVRRLPLLVRDVNGKNYPALTLAVLNILFRMPFPDKVPLENGSINLLARDIPVDSTYSMNINFGSITTNRSYVPYADIITGDFDPSLIKNKIVLVGMTATGEQDTWPIPNLPGKVPGVFIHAATMDTILRENFLVLADMKITALIMLVMLGVYAFVLPRCGTWYWTDIAKGTGVVAGMGLTYFLGSSIMAGRGFVANLFYPTLLLAAVYVFNLMFMLVTEQSDKRFVKGLFGRYVSHQVSQEIVSLASSGKLDLGGEEREVTVLFADIRNYTQISERLSPQEVMKMLNIYLAIVVEATIRNGGIINKFGGDNVMGLWNAPNRQPNHAVLGVKAAWEAQKEVAEMRRSNTDVPAVQFGIGMNTGKALAGNVGSLGRSEYTVIGDTVNLASRICSATPGSEVWIGPETYRLAIGSVEVEKLDPQTFKGKAEPVVVYRVIGWKPENLPDSTNTNVLNKDA